MGLRLRIKKRGFEEEDGGQPVSPSSQSLSTSLLSLCIHVVLEFEQPYLDVDVSKKVLWEALISKNPRFSCILEEDGNGVKIWKKTKVNEEEHLFAPEFPPGQESYDKQVSDYISKLSLTPFNPSRPLWEFHLLNYKTRRAESTLIMKFHHSLGDGISLMSAMFSCMTRADNPNLAPTFPTSKKHNQNIRAKGITRSEWTIFNCFEKLWFLALVLWYTINDVVKCVLRMMGWLEDSKLPIRGPPGVELLPVAISSTQFPMESVKQIKSRVGGTINDVLTGIVFRGIQRYLEICLSTKDAGGTPSLHNSFEKRVKPNDALVKHIEKLRVTTLSMINIRTLIGLENIEEMLKPKTPIPWGNHFGFLHLQIPLKKADNPLEFVTRAKHIIDRQKSSLGIVVITKILGWLGSWQGPQTLAKYVYTTISSTTMAISNMVGPMEKIAIGKNRVKGFSFFVSGAPQALSVYILSYMDTITMQVFAQKEYINAEMLSKLFEEAFEEIKEASIHRQTP